jgi:hypothetical protein
MEISGGGLLCSTATIADAMSEGAGLIDGIFKKQEQRRWLGI